MIKTRLHHRIILNKNLLGFLLLAALSASVSYAQPNYNKTPEFLNANKIWTFGSKCGLDFSSGTAVPIQTSVVGKDMTSGEGYVTVSNRHTGKLLFYSNGGTVWNAANLPMPSGDKTLIGNAPAYSTVQGVVVVPFVNDTNKYYLFSMNYSGADSVELTGGSKTAGTLFYSVIDMTLDGGKGDVVAASKNVVLDKGILTEGMKAIPGCNNDIWLVVHNYKGSEGLYKSYRISSDGVATEPVLSKGKLNITGNAQSSGRDGGRVGIAISSDRKKIAFGYEIGEFNTLTGKVHNPIVLDTTSLAPDPISPAFSPDNSKLYVYGGKIAGSQAFFQYSISNYDSLAIANSKTNITPNTPMHGTLRLYNDTIYIAVFNVIRGISRINNPNAAGLACNFQSSAINMLGGTFITHASLPSEVVFAIPVDTLLAHKDTLICSGWEQGVQIKPESEALPLEGLSYHWSTGDTTEAIEVKKPGVYVRAYKTACTSYNVDSITVRGSDLATTITINVFVLGTTGGPFHSYQWFFNDVLIPGATGSSYEVSSNGRYVVEITDSLGCSYRSEVYTVTNYGTGIKDAEAVAASIRIAPNPAKDYITLQSPVKVDVGIYALDGRLVSQIKNARQISLQDLTSGMYLIRILSQDGQLLKVEKIIKE